MTDYLTKGQDIRERLDSKQRSLSTGSPSAKAKNPLIAALIGEENNQTTNVRTSLTQRYSIAEISKPLESSAAIARILGGSRASSIQKVETSAAPSSYVPSAIDVGTPSSTIYKNSSNVGLVTTSALNNPISGLTSKQNLGLNEVSTTQATNINLTGGISGLDYKSDYKYNPISTNTYTSTGLTGLYGITGATRLSGNYKFDNITTPLTTNIAGTSSYTATNFSKIPDYQPSTTPRASTTTYNIYQQPTSTILTSDLYKNGIGGTSAIESSTPRVSDDYFKIVDSKMLVKGKGITKESDILQRAYQYLPSKQDIYGSLKVNNYNFGGSMSGVNSIRETTTLPYSVTGGVKDSLNLNPLVFKQQVSITSSPRAQQSDYSKAQSVLSKFASYQPTPVGVRQSGLTSLSGVRQSGVSGLKSSLSQANLYTTIQNPVDSVEETIKRANNAVRNSLHSSASNKNLLLENNLGTTTKYTDFTSTPIVNYQPILTNTYTPSAINNNASISINKNYNYESVQPLSTYNNYQTTSYTTNVQPIYTGITRTTFEVDVFSTKWQDIIQRGEKEGLEFSDSEFLPSPAHIGGQYPQQVQWLHPREIFSSYEVFVKGIDPTVLIPGDLGNTYFHGSISALAERDYSILKLFQTKSINRAGCYVLNLCWKGVWTQVILDDRFPVKNIREICFTRSSSNEIWVMLLEKAWAKLHGSYAKIDGGLAREVLHDFTGAPCRTFFINGEGSISKVQLQQRIQHAEDKDLVVLVSCKDDKLESDQEQIKKLYSIDNVHPYTVLGIIELRFQSIDYKFVKLRNPNCKLEWQPDSEDIYFNQLPVDVINKLNYGGRCLREGYFLMEFEHFHRFFTDMQICYQYQGFQYTGEKLCTMRGQRNFYRIEINKPGYYFFQVSQQSIRTERISEQILIPERDFYSQIFLCISSEKNPSQPIIQVTGSQRDLTSFKYIDNPVLLPKGEYYAFVQVDWKSNKSSSGNCGFGAYGTDYIDIRASNSQQCSKLSSHIDGVMYNNSLWEQV